MVNIIQYFIGQNVSFWTECRNLDRMSLFMLTFLPLDLACQSGLSKCPKWFVVYVSKFRKPLYSLYIYIYKETSPRALGRKKWFAGHACPIYTQTTPIPQTTFANHLPSRDRPEKEKGRFARLQVGKPAHFSAVSALGLLDRPRQLPRNQILCTFAHYLARRLRIIPRQAQSVLGVSRNLARFDNLFPRPACPPV